MNTTEKDIADILRQYKKITVIGLSPDAAKPSQKVALYMKAQGFDIVAVRPGNETTVAGFRCYNSLKDVPADYRKFVDVFRANDHIPQVVEEVLMAGGVEVLWLQLGITHAAAEAKAETAGLKVVSDRCLLIEQNKLAR